MKKKILIALNSFKSSGSSLELGLALEKGLLLSNRNISTTVLPFADGGDGTLEVIKFVYPGTSLMLNTVDALGNPIRSPVYIFNNDKSAFVEMAFSSGLKMLKDNHFMNTSSYGTGLVLKQLIELGYKEIIIGIGGTAMVDLGMGMLSALGLKTLNRSGGSILPKTGNLHTIERIDDKELTQFLLGERVHFKVLCDANAYVTGEDGVWQRTQQKGGSDRQVPEIKKGVMKLVTVLEKQTGKQFGKLSYLGCGGGSVAGLYLFTNAEVILGAEYIMDILGIDKAIQKSDIVITGEGIVDETTFLGKATFSLQKRVRQYGKPVIILTGQSKVNYKRLRDSGFEIVIRTNIGATDEYPFVKDPGKIKHMINVGRNLGNLINVIEHKDKT